MKCCLWKWLLEAVIVWDGSCGVGRVQTSKGRLAVGRTPGVEIVRTQRGARLRVSHGALKLRDAELVAGIGGNFHVKTINNYSSGYIELSWLVA